MDLITYSQKRDHLKFLLIHRMVKTVKDIADKLDISDRTALRMVERLKNEGVNIVFCRITKGYIIEE